jgi:type III secretion system YopN/LcrE/InvE/MxiC family regulator
MNTSVPSDFGRIASQTISSPQGSEAVAEKLGRYGGEEVRVTTASEKLAEASEELGMSVAHRVDKKTLQQREVRLGRAANIEALARISEYLDRLPDMPDDAKLKSLVEELESYLMRTSERGGGGPTKNDVLAALQRFDADPTHQFAALDIAASYFAGVDEAMEAALEDAKMEFEREDLARDVRAGFAVAKLAHEAKQTLETDPAAVRETYRRMLREQKHMGQLFDELSSFDGLKKFDEIVDLFLEAAGQDLRSAGPSTDPRFLSEILSELGKLKRLNSVFRLSDQQLERALRLIAEAERPMITPNALTSRLLHFCAKAAPSAADAMGIFEGQLHQPARVLVHLGNGLKSLYDLVPDDVLPGVSAREMQNGALLAWLTSLAEREDAEYQG